MATLKQDIQEVVQNLLSISQESPKVREPIFKLEAIVARLTEQETPAEPASAPEAAPIAPKPEESGDPAAAGESVDGAPVSTPEPDPQADSQVTPEVTSQEDEVKRAVRSIDPGDPVVLKVEAGEDQEANGEDTDENGEEEDDGNLDAPVTRRAKKTAAKKTAR